MSDQPSQTRRLDQWLWFARFYKSRNQAAKAIEEGTFRLNRQVVGKAAQNLRPGDVLTFMRGDEVVVIRVKSIGIRRGPAPEAQNLYEIIAS